MFGQASGESHQLGITCAGRQYGWAKPPTGLRGGLPPGDGVVKEAEKGGVQKSMLSQDENEGKKEGCHNIVGEEPNNILDGSLPSIHNLSILSGKLSKDGSMDLREKRLPFEYYTSATTVGRKHVMSR